MAVTVLKRVLEAVACPQCKAHLAFGLEDVQTNDIGHGPGPEYIICPDCGKTINVTIPRHLLFKLYPND